MGRGGNHLKCAPANDGFGAEYDGMGSYPQGDPITGAQQVTEIGIDQHAVSGPVSGFIYMKGAYGATDPRSQGAGLAGIGKKFVEWTVGGERERRAGEHEPALHPARAGMPSTLRSQGEISAREL